jgi:hypothetical protein
VTRCGKMDGEHRGGRKLKDVVVGSKKAAADQRERAQGGAAAAARKGQVVRRAKAAAAARAKPSAEEAAIEKEVERSMKKGTSLVQAALEHLNTAERLWDKWVKKSCTVINEYPSEKQVVTFKSNMSRSRQRMCLAQRGKRRHRLMTYVCKS